MNRSPSNDATPPRSEIAAAFSACKGALIGVALLSGMLNILMLASSVFMMEVYDRVLPSRSLPTLVGLLAIFGVLYVFQGLIDFVRGRILVRMGAHLDDALAGRVYDVMARLSLRTKGGANGGQPLRDLDQIRVFLSSAGPGALFDLPWMPLYLAICFLFHMWIGTLVLVGMILLLVLTLLTEYLTLGPSKDAATAGVTRNALVEASRRNAEVLQAMGMIPTLSARWRALNERFIGSQGRVFDVAGGLGALSRVLRIALQSCVLALGAYLVIRGEATAGIMFSTLR